MKQPPETAPALKLTFLLVVDIEKVPALDLPVPAGRGAERPGQHSGRKRIEKEDKTGTGRQRKLGGVAAADAGSCMHPPLRAPESQIAPSDARQSRIQFDPDHFPEPHLGGQQDSSPHPRPKIDESEFFNLLLDHRAGPAPDQSGEDRGRNSVISGCVTIVSVPAFEVPASHEPAGANAVQLVEWMGYESFATGEAGQAAAFRRLARGGLHLRTLPQRPSKATRDRYPWAITTQECGCPCCDAISGAAWDGHPGRKPH